MSPSPPRARADFRSYFQRFLSESEFLRLYLWKYRRLVVLGLLALIGVDLLEIVPPYLLKEAVDTTILPTGLVHSIESTHYLVVLALTFLGVSLLQGLGRYGWRMFLIRSSVLAGRDMRESYARHLMKLSLSFFERRSIGDLMSLATNDVEAVRMALGAGLLVLADSLLYFFTIPFAMYWLSPRLTCLAFFPLPILPWLVWRNEREIHARFEKVQASFGKLSAMVQESLNGIRVIKTFAKEDVLIARLREAGEEYVALNLDRARVQAAFGPTLDFSMSLGLVLLLYFGGGWMIEGGVGAVTLGTFVAFQRYLQKMIWPMAALGMALNSYQKAASSTKRLQAVYAIGTDVPEPLHPELPAGGPLPGAPSGGWKTLGVVEMKNLTFRFPGTERDVLCGVSLRVEAGERVAFVGGIGAGKSAILSLLPRLYPVGDGMLKIDGVDVNHWPLEELRRQVGYVSQDLFLFSDTVTENVAFGLYERLSGKGISRIEEATRLADVHDEVLELSAGYRTVLGERGVNLSGGQKQRLTIARAFAKEPSILVLDDALSSVDVQTEERILKGLRSRPGRNTEIIAAHRISTIQDSDRIVVLEQGEVRQLGTHAELVSDRRGLYRRYYEQQRLREDLESYAATLAQPEVMS